ncbi:MAG TPA: bifunctional DNA primase/polymerase [Spirochaetota bacterium]|nr:bifunctional DNA primase/polymerase [Spirochaetota bacterium]
MINNIKKYIKQGIKIFACNSRKAPATRRGFYDATTDINILQQQFTNDDMLIGMPTGNGNNIVIIDIDVNKPMEDESGKKVLDSEGNEIIDPRSAVEILEEFESRFGKLPDTFQVETPSKGIHLYYKVPFTKLSSARRFFCKDLSVDLKANSGYVIVPDGKSDYIVYDDVDGLDIDDIRSRCAPLPDWIENFKKEVIEQKETQENILPPEEVREIRSALAFISPDPRDTWIRVGMELKSMNSPSGYGLWCEWSMGSPKYNPKDQEKRWRTLKPSGEITIASLFYEAKKAGWQSTYGKKDDLSEPEEVFKITTVYDELEKIKDFRVETYNVGPNFTELNHPKVKAIRNALTVIGAERSGGKTSFATSLATDILIHNPSFSLVLFSLDDPETISAKRLISQMLSENVLENSDFDTSSINEVLKRVVITESNVPNTEIIINKKLIKPSTQLVEICERIKKTTDTKNIIIVIDYLQFSD